jgi:hypothetical protein
MPPHTTVSQLPTHHTSTRHQPNLFVIHSLHKSTQPPRMRFHSRQGCMPAAAAAYHTLMCVDTASFLPFRTRVRGSVSALAADVRHSRQGRCVACLHAFRSRHARSFDPERPWHEHTLPGVSCHAMPCHAMTHEQNHECLLRAGSPFSTRPFPFSSCRVATHIHLHLRRTINPCTLCTACSRG